MYPMYLQIHDVHLAGIGSSQQVWREDDPEVLRRHLVVRRAEADPVEKGEQEPQARAVYLRELLHAQPRCLQELRHGLLIAQSHNHRYGTIRHLSINHRCVIFFVTFSFQKVKKTAKVNIP